MKAQYDTGYGWDRIWLNCPGCGVYHIPLIRPEAWNRDRDRPTLESPIEDNGCKFYITNGQIVFLAGTTAHSLLGSYELPDVDGPRTKSW